MTDPSPSIDPAMLAAAASAPTIEPSTREIAWTAAYGPGTPEDALRILASARARRLLTEQWATRCPTADVLDAAIAPADTDDDAALHAKAVHTLLTLHTRTCSSCAARLDRLQTALDDLDHEIDHVEETVRIWTFSFTLGIGINVGAGSPVRGQSETTPGTQPDAGLEGPHKVTLEDPDLYRALTGRPRGKADRWPTVTITATPASDYPQSVRVGARLLVSAGVQPALTVTVILHEATTQDLRISLIPSADGILSGDCVTPAWAPTDSMNVDIEVAFT